MANLNLNTNNIDKQLLADIINDPEISDLLSKLEKNDFGPDMKNFMDLRSKVTRYLIDGKMGPFEYWGYFFELFYNSKPDFLNHIVKIPPYCFHSCNWLIEIKIPDNIVEIGASAFFNCLNLEKIELPDTLKIIRHTAFESCKKLKSINIPKDIELIEDAIFLNAKNLQGIDFNGTSDEWHDLVVNKLDEGWDYNLPFNIPIYCTDKTLFGVNSPD